MMPATLSASSLDTFNLCPRRWVAENYNKTPDIDGIPAMVGTSVHGACEPFVKAVYLDKTHEWKWEFLLAYYQQSYIDTLGNADFDTPEYLDGLQMLEGWFKRTDLSDVEVIEVENKKNFPLKINDEITIPITYIFDRLDRLENGVYKVVDYKSIRKYIPTADLKKRIQPRIYALAVQMEHPDAEKVWVEYDMFRHEPIGVCFTKEENRATYKYLKREAIRILNMAEEDAPERLNAVCGYCVRKVECETLVKHSRGGGLLGLTIVEVAKKKAEVAHALKGLKILDESLTELLVKEAEDQNVFSFDVEDETIGEKITVEISAKKQRKPNVAGIREVIGPELLSSYGNITMTAIDRMLKSDELSDDQKKMIKSMISTSFGETTATVTTENPLADL